MHKADYEYLLSQDVRLSVCPSVTRRYCVETAKCVIKLFTIEYSHIIVVMAIFRRGPLTGASNAGGYVKLWFSTNISLYLGNNTRYGHSYSGMNTKPYPGFRMVPFRMTLSDLEWLSELFNETKHRAVSLRQLSFSSLLFSRQPLGILTSTFTHLFAIYICRLRTTAKRQLINFI